MPNNPDPGELIAMVQHEPDDNFCNRCEQPVSTRDGDDPTPLCDHCAHETVQELASALEQQVARCKKLEEALLFYANPDNYDDAGAPGHTCHLDTDDEYFETDNGELARAALEKP